MKKTIKDLFFLSMPLTESQKRYVKDSSKYLNENELYDLKQFIKTKKAKFTYSNLNLSKVMKDFEYPKLIPNKKITDHDVLSRIEHLNNAIYNKAKEEGFALFSQNAYEIITNLIAPNITGLEDIKKAAGIQLFASDKFHILLLGDPGTGKTDILRSATHYSPISSFGLGSGTSNAGLSITLKGNEIIKGLLPLADGGLCAIDELNLIRKEDLASLYSAMEKGFVSFDKADKHVKMEARINVIATGNPKGDKFTGWMIETLRKQLPFDDALLTRFHLIFLVKKPDAEGFKNITKKIIENQKTIEETPEDLKFIRNYVTYAKTLEVELPPSIAEEIVEYTQKLKRDEHRFLLEVNPRLVHGFINMVKASARMNLRKEATQADFERVKKIFTDALYIKKKEE